MKDITEIEARLAGALDRIGEALAQPAPAEQAAPDDPPEAAAGTAPEPAADPETVARLEEALEAERATNAQLEERVRAIRSRQERQVTRLSEEVERLRDRLAGAEEQGMRLRRLTEQLIESNRALRTANAEGLGDATLINAAIEGERAALAELRTADRAEIDALIGEIAPLVGEDSDA